MGGENSKKYPGLMDLLKSKLIETGKEYLRENFNETKKQAFKYIEKNIENKIKKEFKKKILKIISFILFMIGGLFLLYGGIELILNLLLLPLFLVNIIFGILILIIASIIII